MSQYAFIAFTPGGATYCPFSLAEIANKVTEQANCLWDAGNNEIVVFYDDGEDATVSNQLITRCTLSAEEARVEMVKRGKASIARTDDIMRVWKRWASGDISDEEVAEYREYRHLEYLPDEELECVEKEWIATRRVLTTQE
jgi:hypothetical protein